MAGAQAGGLRPRCCACCCVPRLFSGRRRDRRCWAGLLGTPVGGGPPARRPRCEPRGSARRFGARPGPAAAHGHRSTGPVVHAAPSKQRGISASSRSPARPRRSPRAPQPGSAVARHPPNSRGLACLEISRFSSTRRRPSCSLLVVVASIDLSIPRLFLLIGALHPIRRHCTSSDRVHCH